MGNGKTFSPCHSYIIVAEVEVILERDRQKKREDVGVDDEDE